MLVGLASGAQGSGGVSNLPLGRCCQQHQPRGHQPVERGVHPLVAHQHLHPGVRTSGAVSSARILEQLVWRDHRLGALRFLLLLVPPRQPRSGLVLGRSCGASPEQSLQLVDRFATDHLGRGGCLDFLSAHGRHWRHAVHLRHRRAHRFALPVLGAYQTRGQAGLV